MNTRRNLVGVLFIVSIIILGGRFLTVSKKPGLAPGSAALRADNGSGNSSVASSVRIKRAAVSRNSAIVPSATVTRRFPDCPVLEMREEPLLNGQIRRIEVVEAQAKYPFIRVEAVLRKDPLTGAETVLSVTETVADQVIVNLQEGKQEQELTTALEAVDGKILRKLELDYAHSYLVSLPEPAIDAVAHAIQKLSQAPDIILLADVNAIQRKQAMPSDPSFSQSWHLRNTAQRGGTPDCDIDAEEAWTVHTGSSGVLVAISDSGIDYDHVDLKDNIWQNAADRDGNIYDDDHNGYRDDVRGWDFVDSDNMPTDLDSDGGHGTLVAGIIGARGNNSVGIAGVSWYCRMIPLRVLDSQGLGYNSDIVEGFNYAKRAGAIAINASHGGGGSASLQQAIADLESAGVLLIVPAGNEGNNIDDVPLYPASYYNGNIIAVAATGPSDALTWFSSYGSYAVDVAAPGATVFSTSPGGSFASASGTSFATPVVTGLVALLKAKYPAWNYVQIRNRILSSVDVRSGLIGKCATAGRINAYKAVVGTTPLNKALENSAMTWSAGGNAPWWGAQISAEKGTDWAESGSIRDGQQSYAQATVTGPGTVTFWWKVSSESRFDSLRFQIDGVVMSSISGEVNWVRRSFPIGSGSHTLRWIYAKDESVTQGADKAWLDYVTFFGVPPTISTQPEHQTVNVGSPVSFSVTADGHAPFQYQWRKNGANLAGATKPAFTIQNATRADAGNYSVQVRNAYGQTNSKPAVLTICSVTLSPAVGEFTDMGGSGSISISTLSNCWWTAVTTNDWISLGSAASSQGEGSLSYTVAANNSYESRVGAIFVDDRKFMVAQLGQAAPASMFRRDFVCTITNGSGSEVSDGSFLLTARNSTATNEFRIVPLAGLVQSTVGTATYSQNGNHALAVLSTGSGDTTVEFSFSSPSAGTFALVSPSGSQSGLFVTQKVRPDFNDDAANDLLLLNSNRVLTAWCMDGTNRVQTLRLRDGQALAAGWNVAGTGDLLNRGETDILLQAATGEMALWMMRDKTNVSAGVPIRNGTPPSSGWRAVGLCDFDGDENLDILLQHNDRRAAVWLMNGTQFIRAVLLKNGASAGANWRMVGAHDFTDDGKADILWQHQDGRLALWRMFGLEFIAAMALSDNQSAGAAWRATAINDFNADGWNDILFQHVDGRLKVWLMVKSVFQSSVVLNNGAAPNQGARVVAPK